MKSIKSSNEIIYKTALEHIIDAVVITDTDSIILYVNPAFEYITGYTKDEVVGKNPRILKSGKHNQAFYQEMWETISNGIIWQGQLINKKKSGILYTEAASITPVVNNKGEIINYVATKRDISDFLFLHQELDRFLWSFDQIGEAIIIFKENGMVEYVNTAYEKMSGYNREETIGKHIDLIFNSNQETVIINSIKEVITEKKIWQGTITNIKKTGQNYLIEATVSPVYDIEDIVVNYVLIAKDITKRREMEAALQKTTQELIKEKDTLNIKQKELIEIKDNLEILVSEGIEKIREQEHKLKHKSRIETLGRISTSIAHEIYQPLSTIELSTVNLRIWFQQNGITDKKVLSRIDRIERNSKRVKEFTEMVRSFSTLQKTIQPTPFYINDSINSSLEQYDNRITENGIKVKKKLTSKTLIFGSPTRIEIIVNNILNNAIDSIIENNYNSNSSGTIEITTEDKADKVSVLFSDNGIGIKEEHLPFIFEPFFSTKTENNSLGIGLWVTYSFINDINGKIYAKNNASGGTDFIVEIPV